MRGRTFLLLLVVVAALAVTVVLVATNTDLLTGLLGSGDTTVAQTTDDGVDDAVAAPPTPTPLPLTGVVVTKIDLPVGQRLTADVLELQQRPDDNIAVQAGYVFTDIEDLIGRIIVKDIGAGQAVLDSMVALTPRDIASMGSDLSLYMDSGNVAIAFPINRYDGVAYAMRPGDNVDVLMSLNFLKLDEEFQTALPNLEVRVDQEGLLDGQPFLFSGHAQGRYELVPGVNLVGSIGPGNQDALFSEEGGVIQIARRATQLTVQQARVLWVGTWSDPQEAERLHEEAVNAALAAGQPLPTPLPSRLERSEEFPDVVILSMSAQDALVLKWAMDRGVDLDLVLRAQGDNSVFVTTTVSLPQMIEQGGLTIPVETDFGLEERAEEVERPSLPPNPLEN